MMRYALILSLLTATWLGNISWAQQTSAPTTPKLIAGKVVAVSHEKVTLNNLWFDKITVTVDRCDARGALATVHYAPGTVSDRTALGHLLPQNMGLAQMPNMERQQQPNGFGLFWTDANGRILRTGIMGSQLGCNDVPRLSQQFK